jgi:hypothetical protein
MTDETKYEWFHKDRQFFFLKKDGEITHCYQLARELCSDVDKNRWWEVGAVVPKDLTRHKNITICADNGIRCLVDDLIPVPRDSEIEYQLHSLDDAEHPIAGVFMKNIRGRHPRRHQWGELGLMDHVPERWLSDPMTVPDDRDFVSAPFLTEADQL